MGDIFAHGSLKEASVGKWWLGVEWLTEGTAHESQFTYPESGWLGSVTHL